MKKVTIILSFLFLLAGFAVAASVEERAQGTVSYEGGAFSNKPNADEMQKGVEAAKVAAWNKFLSKMTPAQRKSYEENKAGIKYSDYILNVVKINEDVDKSAKTYTVTIRMEIDKTGFDGKLASYSKLMQTDSEERSYVLGFFVGRKISEVTAFDDKRIKQATAEASVNNSVNTEVGETSESTTQSASSSSRTVTGGSTTQKRNKQMYEIETVTGFDSAFNNVLTDGGFETGSYSDIIECDAPSMNDIKIEFAENDEMSPEVESRVKKAAKECEISYLTFGTLNISMPKKDPVSGNQVVTATITGKVVDLRGKRSRTVGSVGPEIFSGMGEDENVARDKAIKAAAQRSAKTIIDQLHSKDVR